MASVRKIGDNLYIRFRFPRGRNCKQYEKRLGAVSQKEAAGIKAIVERTIAMLEEGVLEPPLAEDDDGTQLWDFLRTGGKVIERPKVIKPASGRFYVVRLHPLGRELKLGYTTNLDIRLKKHRTCNPLAEVIKTYRSVQAWESAVLRDMRNARNTTWIFIGQEVCVCEPGEVIEYLDKWFLAPDGY